MCKDVHSSFIQNSQKLEKISINSKWVKIMCYIITTMEYYQSNLKKNPSDTCNYMDGSHRYNVE